MVFPNLFTLTEPSFAIVLKTLFYPLTLISLSIQNCTTASFSAPTAAPPVECPPGYFGSPPACACLEDNTAYFGNNALVGSSNPQPSRLACQRSCEDHPDCQYWTWGKGSPGPCYLKHARENVTPGLESYVSASKSCPLPESSGTA